MSQHSQVFAGLIMISPPMSKNCPPDTFAPTTSEKKGILNRRTELVSVLVEDI
jgi:hypothetical protein